MRAVIRRQNKALDIEDSYMRGLRFARVALKYDVAASAHHQTLNGIACF